MSESVAGESDESQIYLDITRLTKNFGAFVALQDVSLQIRDGEFVCFLGPSGCGKTTLLRAIAGLDIQTAGRIEQAGIDVSALPPSERDFGIVFQSYALFPNLTVGRNVAYGLENRRRSRPQIEARVSELLELVDLSDQSDKYPAQLSGGQQQRVALARALAPSPGLLLLDEPLSALDAKVRVHLRGEIKTLQHRLGVTTIMVTHDQEEALTMADRIVVINAGVVEQVGTPVEIYRQPASEFVADFIGTMNFMAATATAAGEVEIGSLRLRLPDVGVPVGERVKVAIRPEDIVVRTEDSTPSENEMTAAVRDVEFLGSYIRAYLDPALPGEETLTADISLHQMRALELSSGDHLSIALPADRLRVYPIEP